MAVLLLYFGFVATVIGQGSVTYTTVPIKPSRFGGTNIISTDHQVTFTNTSSYPVVFSATLRNASGGTPGNRIRTNICERKTLQPGHSLTIKRGVSTLINETPNIEIIEKSASDGDRRTDKSTTDNFQQAGKVTTKTPPSESHHSNPRQAISGKYTISQNDNLEGRTWSISGKLTLLADGSGVYTRTISQTLRQGSSIIYSWQGKSGERIHEPKSLRDTSTYSVRWNLENKNSISLVISKISGNNNHPRNLQWSDRFGQESDNVGSSRTVKMEGLS